MLIGIASADFLRSDQAHDGQELWGGSGWARIGQYVPHWRAAGHEVVVGWAWGQSDKYFSIEDAQGNHAYPNVIIMQRLMHDMSKVIRSARDHGQIIIHDVDDWYWGLDPANEAFKASHPKHNERENTRFYASSLAAASLLTVSTPYLADRIRQRARTPITLVPNYVDVSRFTPVTQSEGPPQLGWAGSTSHRSGDIETLRGVIKQFLTDGRVRLHHSGAFEGAPTFASQIGIEPELITTSPRTNFGDYPSMLTFDVGLIPLRDTPFNHAKSDIKGLEYAASGIPFIASALSPYQGLFDQWSPDPGFFIAKRGHQWIKGIDRLLDYETRLKAQAIVLEKVQQRDIQYGVRQWLDLFDKVVDKAP